MKRTVIPAFAVLLSAVATVPAATVAIDVTQTFQTIEGFGGQHIRTHKIKDGPFTVDAPMGGTYDSIVSDLGLNVHRHFIPKDAYPEGPGQPLGSIGDLLDVMRELKSRGVVRFIPAVLSPAAWMKTNESYIQGGTLLPAMYDEFARFCAEYCKLMEAELGVYPYAFSIQNELAFVEPYGSCVYTPEEFHEVLRVVGEKFVSEGIPTRMYGPECMGTYMRSDGVRNYMAPLRSDMTTASYLSSLAVHGYKDGIAIDYGSAPGWSAIREEARVFGIPVWMTETGGYSQDDDWSGALDLGKSMHIALEHGDLGLWCYLDIASTSTAGGALLIDGAPRHNYSVAKHYYRYVRAGACRTEASCDDPDLLVTAYRHDAESTFTIVLINQATSAKPVTLSGAGLPDRFARYESTSSRACEPVDTVSPGESFAVPASSITTIFSDHPSTIGVAPRLVRASRAPVPVGAHYGTIVALSGRLVRETERPGAGVYCVDRSGLPGRMPGGVLRLALWRR